jgi:NADPH:quinone reductase-like Zn-dependent oxidoreductase
MTQSHTGTLRAAARISRFGGPEVIAIEEIAAPVPARNEVLVRVHAAGVGPWDAWIREGQSVVPQPLPLTLGSELSGVVAAIGPGVEGIAVGDEVFGATNARFVGAYAELALASADLLARKPATLDHVAAASVPVVAVTAWQMLFDTAHLTRGQSVLVTGAAGNVGAYAVQLAHGAGAHVIGAVGAARMDEVRKLGADETIAVPDVFRSGAIAPLDVVIDTVGGDVARRSLGLIKPGGILVTAVSHLELDAESERHQVRAEFILVRTTASYLRQIASRLDEGTLVARVGTVLPLAEARQAHELLAAPTGRPAGKIVLRVNGG